jgi:uncharacterized protein (DUF427 family)
MTPRVRAIPRAGQESVWDYPRPPACVSSPRHVVVRLGGQLVADTRSAWRVLETSHPPTWYLPQADVLPGVLQPSRARSTFCEWKGPATYWDVAVPGVDVDGNGDVDWDGAGTGAGDDDGQLLEAAAWSYEDPTPGFTAITGHLAFSPSRLTCTVDGETVRPQEGNFYAGWITDDVVGPFKGAPGTLGW